MTGAELSAIADDAVNLYGRLLNKSVPPEEASLWVAHAMPAIVTRATDGGPDIVFRTGGPRYSDTPPG